MKNITMIRLFLCLVLVQLFVPATMILKREVVLKYGEQFKFKAAPVDPYDAFRGRYVALKIDEDYVSLAKETNIKHGQTIYALIEVDGQGFAKFSNVALNRPYGKAYIQAKAGYPSYEDKNKLYLELPFSRYYMEEKAAPVAEEIYQRYAQAHQKDAYVIVRIKDGFAVIENLYVGGKRIEDAVKQWMQDSSVSNLSEDDE